MPNGGFGEHEHVSKAARLHWEIDDIRKRLSEGRVRKEYVEAMTLRVIQTTLLLIAEEGKLDLASLELLRSVVKPLLVRAPRWYQFWKRSPI